MAYFVKNKYIFVVILITFFGLGIYIPYSNSNLALAQTQAEIQSQKAKLESELADLEAQIAQKEKELESQKGQSKTISGEISTLTKKIDKAKLDIKAKNLLITKLSGEIVKKEDTIKDLQNTLEKEKESLSYLIRKTNEIDNSTFIHLMLGEKTISDYYSDVNTFHYIKSEANKSVEKITEVKGVTEKEKEDLDDKKTEELGAKLAIEDNKKRVELDEKQKQTLLKESKNKEKTIELTKSELDKKRAAIRAQLFSLRDTAAIPFGKAYDIAVEAEKVTGVRPAFILSILTQETNLGQNLGTCNRPQDPVNKKWQAIMPGPADIAAKLSKRDDESAYIRITSALGLDKDTMPLSCPFGSGWGGAMGPSQFIPTTWEGMATKISRATGKSGMPNPWDPRDAIFASSVYLGELGASQRTATAEKTAALKYYSGSGWQKASNQFYGNQVMARAKIIQETMIDPLLNN